MTPLFGAIKICENKEFADCFRRGNLYCNRLRYFKKKGVDDYEGDILMWPDQVALSLGGQPLPILTRDDFLDPVRMSLDRVGNLHVFCMHGLYSNGNPTTTEELKEQLEISERCMEDFGEHAVIIKNGEKFFRRVNEAVRRNNYRSRHGLVKYYQNIHPALESDLDGAFYKREKYIYQREYRIAISTGTIGCDPFVLDIGDLTDITEYVRTEDINKELQIRSK